VRYGISIRDLEPGLLGCDGAVGVRRQREQIPFKAVSPGSDRVFAAITEPHPGFRQTEGLFSGRVDRVSFPLQLAEPVIEPRVDVEAF